MKGGHTDRSPLSLETNPTSKGRLEAILFAYNLPRVAQAAKMLFRCCGLDWIASQCFVVQDSDHRCFCQHWTHEMNLRIKRFSLVKIRCLSVSIDNVKSRDCRLDILR